MSSSSVGRSMVERCFNDIGYLNLVIAGSRAGKKGVDDEFQISREF
jgi:hypothetical protein